MNEQVISAALRLIGQLLERKDSVLIAIDGRCGSGKTTLARELQTRLTCTVVHMDDFFLRPCQRKPERFAEPGGNVDRERFLEEVLKPLAAGKPFAFRPYDCATQTLTDPVEVTPAAVRIVEGSYACHPLLTPWYNARIFLTLSPEEQQRRILLRNGPEKLEMFKSRWIPFEEKYFSAFDVENKADLVLTTD